mgnify:CR=1 FL=1
MVKLFPEREHFVLTSDDVLQLLFDEKYEFESSHFEPQPDQFCGECRTKHTRWDYKKIFLEDEAFVCRMARMYYSRVSCGSVP